MSLLAGVNLGKKEVQFSVRHNKNRRVSNGFHLF